MSDSQPRLIELKRTVEVGPYTVKRGAAVHFVVKVYKDLKARNMYFPIVFRRDVYRLKPSFASGVADEVIEVSDDNYRWETFKRASEAAALKAVVDKIRGDFEPAYRPKRTSQS